MPSCSVALCQFGNINAGQTCRHHEGPISGCTKEGPLIGKKGEEAITVPAHLSGAAGQKAKG